MTLAPRILALKSRLAQQQAALRMLQMKRDLLTCLKALYRPEGWWVSLGPRAREWQPSLAPFPLVAGLREDIAKMSPSFVAVYAKQTAHEVMRHLRSCRDRLPAWARRELGLSRNGTYAQAAALLAADLKRADKGARRPADRRELLEAIGFSNRKRRRTCVRCRAPLPPPRWRGRPRRLCSDACRAAVYRRRQRSRVKTWALGKRLRLAEVNPIADPLD